MSLQISSDPRGELSVKESRQTGLSAFLETRLKTRLRREAPSEPWVEAQFRTLEELDPRGARVLRRIHDPSVFPPGGPRTAMVRCRRCKVYTPPGGMEGGDCLDHSEHVGWGPSPSATAIRALQYFNVRIGESELPPESTSALRREIADAMQNAKKNKCKSQPAPTSKLSECR